MMNHQMFTLRRCASVAAFVAAMMLLVAVAVAESAASPATAASASFGSPTTQPGATTTRPSPSPASTMPADQLLQQMLRPAGAPAARPLSPVENLPTFNQTTGTVAPPAPPSPALIREGDYIRDRVGRLNRTVDGQFEFVFDSDGQALQD